MESDTSKLELQLIYSEKTEHALLLHLLIGNSCWSYNTFKSFFILS